MFRVGFGDFFLLSIPASPTAKHILIDCGVHAKDVKSIRDAVTQMAKDCNSHLSLIIMTHRHADHISGFGTCSDIFSGITVDRVWMPWFEDCKNNDAKAIQAGFTTLATQLTARLAARSGAASEQLARMVENITGGIDTMGIAANQKALDVLHGGFKNKPEHDYYHAGDTAKLPDDLVAAGLTAQILGPPSDPALIKQMTNKAQQYLAGDRDSDSAAIAPFAAAFRAGEKDYPPSAFRFHTAKEITAILKDSQPDMLEAQALAADNTLNNQSLVVFFSFAGKNLLFAGDAQWGNWEHFLYGGAYGTSGHTAITSEAKAILGAIDFYKVGHHGSANATPKDAVAAMRLGCVGMCSTAIEAYNEVPREPLLTALRGRMNGQLARSDQVPAGNATANSKAGVLQLPFVAPTKSLFIDYNF
jgi:beta-lactamase superfamily II metal-dependent hydrolase